MSPVFEVNVYVQNNDTVRMLEAQLEDARRSESLMRLRCAMVEQRLADAQHVNMELTDLLKSYGFKYRRTADMRSWYLPKDAE